MVARLFIGGLQFKRGASEAFTTGMGDIIR